MKTLSSRIFWGGAYEYLINYFADSAGKKGGEFYMSAEVRLSANDLNAWFFADGRNAAFADHFRFRTEADWLVADLSVPLSFMADAPLFPSIRSRYFKRTDRGTANHRKWRIQDSEL